MKCCWSVASRQGRQGRQSLGAPEWKGPPSRVSIFLRTRQLTDSAYVRRPAMWSSRSHWVERIICQHVYQSEWSQTLAIPKQKHIVGLQIVAPSCACRAAAFLDLMDPSRINVGACMTPVLQKKPREEAYVDCRLGNAVADMSKIRSFYVTTTAGEDETSEGNPENSKHDAVCTIGTSAWRRSNGGTNYGETSQRHVDR